MSINVALVGVGNCASSLIQGIRYYRGVDHNSSFVPGLMHNIMAKYKISDIEFVGAIDIDKRKVSKDLSEAIFSKPNCTKKFASVPNLDVEVVKGPVFDSIAKTTKKKFLIDSFQTPVNVKKYLREKNPDILINYLPVGSEKATRYYAKICLENNISFINAIPVFVVSDSKWEKKFKEKRIPVIGDDVKSQVGATILHRTLTNLFVQRGVKLEETYQLNIGGNTDFLNMLERKRLKSKKISKTESVRSQLPKKLKDKNIHVGPSDYVPQLKDQKLAFIKLYGKKFGNIPINLEVKLEVEDSPNSGGVMVDAIRCAKIALDRGIGGALIGPSCYFMKTPPVQYPDSMAREMVEDFLKGKRS